MQKAIYFHAGCPVCVEAEDVLVDVLAGAVFEIEKVHLGDRPELISQARESGVTSVPALVVDSQVFHINHGAAIDDLAA